MVMERIPQQLVSNLPLSFSVDRSQSTNSPASSPISSELSFGCSTAQLIGRICLMLLAIALLLMSNTRKYPSSQAVKMYFSCFQKHPTAVTLPLKSLSKERMACSGLLRSQTFTQLFMPTTTLLLSSVISMRLGAPLRRMVSLGLLLPVEGSQKRMVLSQDPLANLRVMQQSNQARLRPAKWVYIRMDDFDQCGKCGNSHDGACSTEPLHFYWYPHTHEQVTQVCVIGDWSKWQRKEPMTMGVLESGEPYFYTLLALSEGFHQYKYLVDGRWAVDPKAPTLPNPMGTLNNRVEILPKKSYVEKHPGSGVRISSNFCVEGLKIIGSWDEWTEERSMEKTFNPLRAADESVVYLDLPPDRTYQFKFRHGSQFLVDQKYPTTPNPFGSLNNFIIVVRRASLETPSRKRVSTASLGEGQEECSGRRFRWKRTGQHLQLPYERVQGHGMCWVGECIYIFGGKSRNEFYNSLIRINSSFDRAHFEEIVPDGRAFHCMQPYGNKILIYGGHNNRVLEDYHAFNVSDAQWHSSPALPKRHSRQLEKQSCVLHDSLLVFFGGYYCLGESQCENLSDEIEVLDLEKMQWIEHVVIQGEHPPGRYGHTAARVDSYMYVFAGIYDPRKLKNLNDLWRLDLANVPNLQWERVIPKGEAPSPRHGHTMTPLGSLLLIFGGHDDANTLLNDLTVFRSIDNEWVTPLVTGSIPRPRSNHAATNFIRDQVVIFGGKTSENNKNRNFYLLEPADLPASSSFFWAQQDSD